MFCPECGFENEDENKFCLKCGKVLVLQDSTEKQYVPEEEQEKDKLLQSALKYMSMDKRLGYKGAITYLNRITGYKNADELKKQCEEKFKANSLETAVRYMNGNKFTLYENAYKILSEISGYENADELKKQCEEKISELKQQQAFARKKYKKIAIYVSIPVAVLLAAAIIIVILITPKLKYDKATEYLDNSDYAKASGIFEEIEDYKDSKTALNYISVLDGSITDYDEKIEILESLGDYRNAKELLLEIKYEKASELAADKNYLEAVELIDSLGDYGDPDGIKQGIYKKAVGFFDDRKFSKAAELFLILGKYEDSEDYIDKIYEQAGTYFKDKKYNYAASVYMNLGDYSDSLDKIDEIYQKCLEYIDKGKYVEAVPILKNLKDYKDSESKLEKIYDKALSLIGDKKYDDAAKIFEKLGKYKESESKLNVIAELQNKDKYDKAVKLGEDEKYDDAIKLFEELGDYSDSKDQIKEMKKKRDADTYEMKGTTAWVKIDNGYLNVRKTANSDAASVGKLYNGDEVTIQATSSNGKWYKVTSGSITGYCSVDYITTSKPIENISGSWVDVNSSYALHYYTMEITDLGDNAYSVSVGLSLGAYERYSWNFSGTMDSTGTLYIDESTSLFGTMSVSENGQVRQSAKDSISGTLTYSNGNLIWNCYCANPAGDVGTVEFIKD